MDHAPPLRVVVLGTGSSGNATVISDGATTVLLDCGFSARETARRLEAAGFDASRVDAVLLTHEHTDHVSGLDVFVRRHAPGCAVFATRGTRLHLARHAPGPDIGLVEPGEPLRVGGLEVLAFRTSHDASDPVGYRVDSRGGSVGVATDTGVLTEEAAEALTDVEVLCLESNHDVAMLESGPYPYHLKRRIRSHAGHLSNTDAADALERLASDRLTTVCALHRSRTNNTSELARRALTDRATRNGLEVQVLVASQHKPCDTQQLDPPDPTS